MYHDIQKIMITYEMSIYIKASISIIYRLDFFLVTVLAPLLFPLVPVDLCLTFLLDTCHLCLGPFYDVFRAETYIYGQLKSVLPPRCVKLYPFIGC